MHCLYSEAATNTVNCNKNSHPFLYSKFSFIFTWLKAATKRVNNQFSCNVKQRSRLKKFQSAANSVSQIEKDTGPQFNASINSMIKMKIIFISFAERYMNDHRLGNAVLLREMGISTLFLFPQKIT